MSDNQRRRNATTREVLQKLKQLKQERDVARKQAHDLNTKCAVLSEAVTKARDANEKLRAECERLRAEIEDQPLPEPFQFTQPAPPVAMPRKTQTVELTAKRWKALMLIGGALTLVGGAIMFAGFCGLSPILVMGGSITTLAGALTFLIGKAGKFWFHE